MYGGGVCERGIREIGGSKDRIKGRHMIVNGERVVPRRDGSDTGINEAHARMGTARRARAVAVAVADDELVVTVAVKVWRAAEERALCSALHADTEAVAYGATLLGAVPQEGVILAARAERYASAEPCEVVPFWPNADGFSMVAELFFRIVAADGSPLVMWTCWGTL